MISTKERVDIYAMCVVMKLVRRWWNLLRQRSSNFAWFFGSGVSFVIRICG